MSDGSPSIGPHIRPKSGENSWSIPMIISTMARWWCGSRVAAGVRVQTLDVQELPTEGGDAIDLVRMDDDGWQLAAAASRARLTTAGMMSACIALLRRAFSAGAGSCYTGSAFLRAALQAFRIRFEFPRLSCVSSPSIPLEPAIR